MSATKRIVLFVAGLAVVFAAAAGLGSLVEPAETDDGGAGETMAAHSAHETEAAGHEPAGLGIAEGGYSLRLATNQFGRDKVGQLSFSVVAGDGEPVTEFDQLHERRLHLIIVRRDGTEFRHLHPEMDAAGVWTVPVGFAAAGVYRAFADFSVDGEQQTLAGDLFVSGGDFKARPFPAPRPLATSDGYEVTLAATDLMANEPTELSFAVSENGRPIDDLDPYLGAKGHLVALREGDLAFLHVHPEESEVAANEIAFEATFPSPGRYRLYLQFRHEGAVRTAEFTLEVPR
ncbi:MAG TPA: hypothetical protein VI039_01005 [Solirubrobacterales bacterium]